MCEKINVLLFFPLLQWLMLRSKLQLRNSSTQQFWVVKCDPVKNHLAVQ